MNSTVKKIKPLTGYSAYFFLLLCVVFSNAHAHQTGVATAHPLATKAAHQILAQGGNAFDAAVAATAVLAVVEPAGSGLGGGGFWLLHRAKDGFETMLDGREMAPGQAHRDMYLDKEGNVIPKASIDGSLAAGIPGVPAALAHLAENYGNLELAKTLLPAIRYAREGFAIDSHMQNLIKFRQQALLASPAAAKIFLVEGKVPPLGYEIVQADLANTLQMIADTNGKGFYQGAFANTLASGVKIAGGIWQVEDLINYKLIEREPIRGEYHGMKITSAAPPSSGGVALVTMLNILEGFDLDAATPVQRKHLIIEAMRRAYRDRAQYLGDTDFIKVPLERLTSKVYAAGLRAAISPNKAMPSALLPTAVNNSGNGTDTTHFSIIDADGNRVAATLSINYPFGSAFMVPGTGVLLNNEMDDFSAKPGVANVYGLAGAKANAIEPGKRPLSSMSPTFLEDDKNIIILGAPGGSRIITMVLLGILEYANGGYADSIVKLGRYHHQYLPDKLIYEEGALSKAEIEQLEQWGHTVEKHARTFGNMQVVIIDKNSETVSAASDPRRNGQASVK
ncbi:MAG: gamma-glutamyltransferase [Gammaproteobacteria bacterium]|nr:gamma-glutamyltransferase [Gammaproteobacteria bacterium]